MPGQVGGEKRGGNTAGILRVCLLGPPAVVWADRPLPLPRRQVRALLYRLAVEGQPVPREQLSYLFWADRPEAIARRNLRGLLTHLRRALPLPDMLLSVEDTVGLDPDRIWSDTVHLARLSTKPGPPIEAEALHQAVDLYRGPFLAGFSLPGCPQFEVWATTERQIRERAYLEMLATLVENQAARGAYAAAIALANRYLATDVLAEDIHRSLIELYAASGDRGAALRQFEECIAVLERELGVDPLPETQAAYRAVLDGSTLVGTGPLPGSELGAKPAWTTLPGLDVPMIGRDEAMDQLAEAYARASAGKGGVLLISGEAGIGKSRLMQDFAMRQQGRARVLVGAGYPEAQTMPYQPLVEALRPALGSPQLSSNVQPRWLAESSRLMPELDDLYPSLPSPLPAEPEQARARLFEALCRLALALAAGPEPLLLCLDDLHWADGTTLDWLAHLGRKLHGGRLLVLGTFRSEEAGAMAALRRGLARQNVLSELRLESLDRAAVLRLLRVLGDPIPGHEALAGRLHRATGGNPFFLLETLRALVESDLDALERRVPAEGTGHPAEEQALPLPETVRAAVQARVARLSARARQVLEAGAVLGCTFAFDTVCRTAGRRELETVDGLDELAARQLLGEREGEYRFSHEIIRSVVYHGLGLQRRRLLHRRAGEALETVEPGAGADLARHFELAGDLGRAARYALQAGLAAKVIYGHAEARDHFDHALSLLEREAADLDDAEAAAANRRLRIQALYERGWALRLLGDMEAHARDLQEVTRLAELLCDTCTLAHLHWREAYTHRWFCRYTEARKAAEEGFGLRHAVGVCTLVKACRDEGLRVNEAAGHCLFEAMCWREVGLAAREMGDYQQAQSALEQALAVYVRLGESAYEIHTMGNLSMLYWYMGKHEKAMDLARQALARCDDEGMPMRRRLPLGDMGAAAAAIGDADLARQCLMESLEIARQVADRTQEVFCLGHLGWLHAGLAQPARAAEHLQAGLTLAQRIRSCAAQSWLLSGLAEARRLAGDRAGAQVHAQRALDLARANGRPYDKRLARHILDRLDGG